MQPRCEPLLRCLFINRPTSVSPPGPTPFMAGAAVQPPTSTFAFFYLPGRMQSTIKPKQRCAPTVRSATSVSNHSPSNCGVRAYQILSKKNHQS